MPPSSARALLLRVLSSVVLIGIAVGATHAGGTYFAALVVLFGAAMAWEWSTICDDGRLSRAGVMAIAVTAASIAIGASGWLMVGIIVAVVGAAANALAWRRSWPSLGILYATLPCLSLIWLREGPDGAVTILWVFALVWAADTFAYIFGRVLGGPRLAPRISPKKTLAGLGGAIAGAALATAAFWAAGLGPGGWRIVAFGAGLAVIEQAGDLLESAYKRHFGVKDSSRLIPGHGGVLDRVDGLVAVALAVALTRLAGVGPFAS